MLAAVGAGAQEGDRSGRSWSLEDLAVERYVQARHEADLLRRPGVVGVGIGLGDDGKPALTVLVDASAPTKATIPAALDGVAVRVEEVTGGGVINGGGGCGAFPNGCHTALFAQPIPMGTSTSSRLVCDAGTLGFKACDATNGYPGYVTASHVATATQAPIGTGFCEGRAPLGTQQVHRGNFETSPTCNANFVIGGLDRFVPIAATGNLVDAAFVRSNDNRTSPAILDAHAVTSVAAPALNTCVAKSGRTTGYTPARINLVNLTWNVFGYCLNTDEANQNAQFTGLFRFGYDNGSCGTCSDPDCWDVALGGDSGSAVVHRYIKGRLLGLLFANLNLSNPNAGGGREVMGLASPAQDVLDELDLTLCN